jgi:hypothetical protein
VKARGFGWLFVAAVTAAGSDRAECQNLAGRVRLAPFSEQFAGVLTSAAEAVMVSYRAAEAYASLALFVVTVRRLIDRGVLSKADASEVLDEAEGMLTQNGETSSNAADAIELLRTDIRKRIGVA